MENLYCPHCQANRGFKRALGCGTIIMIFITCGLWLLTLPLYPKRCIQCGGEWSDATAHRRQTRLEVRKSGLKPRDDGKIDIWEAFENFYARVGIGGMIIGAVIIMVLFSVLKEAIF